MATGVMRTEPTQVAPQLYSKLDAIIGNTDEVEGKLDLIHADVDQVEPKLDILHDDGAGIKTMTDATRVAVNQAVSRLTNIETNTNRIP